MPRGGTSYECGSLAFTADELAGAPPAGDLRSDGQAALDGYGTQPIDLAEGWRVLTESRQTLELIRELDEPPPSGPGATARGPAELSRQPADTTDDRPRRTAG